MSSIPKENNTIFSEFRDMFKHFSIYGLGEVINKAIGFLLIPVYARYLAPQDYGVLQLLALFAAVLSIILSLRIVSGLFRSYFEYEQGDEKGKRRLVTTAFIFTSIVGLILIVSLSFWSKEISKITLGQERYHNFIKIILLYSFFQVLYSLALAILRASLQSSKYVFFSILFLVMQLLFIVYFVIFLHQGVLGVIIGQLIATILVTSIIFYTIRRNFAFALSFGELRAMLSFSLPLIPAALFHLILTLSDRFFLRYYWSLSEVGVYSLGYKFGMLAAMLLVTPFGLIWPIKVLSVKDREDARAFYSKILTYFTLIGLLLSLFISVGVRDVLKIVADSSYWNAYRIVALICVSYLLLGVFRIFNVGITLRRKTKYIPFIVGTGALTNIFLNFLLIPKYGMIGAAIATLISYFVLVIFQYFVTRNLYRIDYEWGRIMKLVGCALIIYFVATNVAIASVWASLIAKLGMVLFFPLLLVPMKFYEKKEKWKIREIWRVYLTRISGLINLKVDK